LIELQHVSKTFETAGGRVDALKDVSLTIASGDIYGIIGMSGAGKSTLVRCINMLERPTEGRVIVNGQQLDAMTPAQLRAARREITMIFQRFNLLMQRTCLQNICFPMELAGVSRKEAQSRARALLGEEPVEARIHLHGSFAETGAGHGTDRALVGGLLGMKPDDPRLPDAFAEAEKAGLTYTIDEIKLRDAHPNTAVIEAKSADGRTLTMQASSIGGGRIMVNKLDGIDVNFNGMFNTLVIRNQDASGTVAAITSILSQLRVNVANMSLYRHKRGGDALMVIELDQHLKPSQVAFLSELPGVLSMTYYDKEEDDDGSGFDEGNI